ncbi:hypothetical protein BDR26DRAFT_906316 [Obelidium mucronatum]|nr:hypothetical protein BDR26DRAFT_906316 [Obelidium mucronatum]
MKAKRPQPVLTVGDVSLYDSDLLLLRDGEWLNDSLLQFAFETQPHDAGVALLSPSLVHLVANVDLQSAEALVGGLRLRAKTRVFLALNDGGSHWSLLEFARGPQSAVFRHYDSLGAANARVARRAAAKWAPLLAQSQSQTTFEQVAIRRQENNADCGVFVAAIVAQLLEGRSPDQLALAPEDMGRKRRELEKKARDLISENKSASNASNNTCK